MTEQEADAEDAEYELEEQSSIAFADWSVSLRTQSKSTQRRKWRKYKITDAVYQAYKRLKGDNHR